MPIDRIYTSPEAIWGYWKIEEDERALALDVPFETTPPALTNPLKRLEFLAGRVLIKTLLDVWEMPFDGLTKDEFGKPFLTGSHMKTSLSHSYPYVAAILHRHKNVGIDLEQPKNKLLRIGPRVLSASELEDAGQDIVKHCIYWCAKESMIKIHGKKDLIFSRNLIITPFSLRSSGHLVGRIIANHTETTIPLDYHVTDNFVVVVSG
jgi:4'-phosphopantetheinyl transferase EntD